MAGSIVDGVAAHIYRLGGLASDGHHAWGGSWAKCKKDLLWVKGRDRAENHDAGGDDQLGA